MSKYSWVDRKTNTVHPWGFKRISDNVYNFSVGSKTVAQLHKMGPYDWAVVVWTDNPKMGMAEGFRSRHAAAQFALKSARMTDG